MPKHDNDLVIQVQPEVLRIVALSAISGVRSMAAPALLARAIESGDVGGLRGTRLAALGSANVSTLLQALMLGEMVMDKTPFLPARTAAGSLFGRVLSGALVGSALFISRQRPGAPGTLLGVLSAMAGVYAADRLRSATTQGLGLPDPIFGLIEDGLVLFGGSWLLHNEPGSDG